MAKATPKLRFFTDANVPDSVGDYLRLRGHSVHRMRHHMPVNSADPIVATAAMRDNRILVSQDKDFGHQRFMAPRFASLNRLALVGAGPTLSSAVKQYMHLIELHWSHKSRKGARLTIHVKADEVRFRD